jgi:beta-mannosidase
MRHYNSTLFAVISITFLLLNLRVTGQEGRIDLNNGWTFREQGSAKWYPAQVPGCVQTDLIRNNIIPEPFFRDNESQIQWVSDTGWVYTKTFDLPESFFAYRNVDLVCEGLDTYANVYLNDSLVMTSDNMFKAYYGRVKHLLVIGQNRLRIEFPSITARNKELYSKFQFKLPGDERTVSRKAAYQYGWDFAPKVITMGIWKPVYLHYYTYINVLGVRFIQKSLSDSVAKMSAVFTLTSALADSALFKISNGNEIVFSENRIVKKGVNVVRVDFDIRNPKRWWPNGMGAQNLYDLGYQVWFAARKEGEGSQKIGLRTVELVQREDSIGKTFFFKVNGRAVFSKGANYVPMDVFPARITDSSYISLITQVKDANMNMLRVWGGGVYPSDKFYELCDENGIMVWQDFMFACAMVPGSSDFKNTVRDEVIQTIVRLRQHPSLVLWCGNNEIDEGWKNWGWQKQYGYSPEDSNQVYRYYKNIFHDMIPYNVDIFDTLRPYITSSPKLGWGRQESVNQADMHYWGVWWGKEPFENYEKKVGRFMSEYGFQSFPDYRTIKSFTWPMDRVQGSPIMKAHQKHPVGYETIDEYMQRDFRTPKNMEMYGYVSQVLQAEGIGMAIAAHRRDKPRCMGSLFWQLNDCWPGVTWSAIDYYGRPKALYYEAKRLFSMYMVKAYRYPHGVIVYGMSDGPLPKPVKSHFSLYDLSGNLLWKREFNSILNPAASEVQWRIPADTLLAGRDSTSLVLLTEITDKNGVVASDVMKFVPFKEMNLQKPVIGRVVESSDDGYTITLSTDKPAFFVHLSYDGPGEFSDNDFDLMPGHSKTVTFKSKINLPKFGEMMKIISLVDSY